MNAPTIIAIEVLGDKGILKLDDAPNDIAGIGENGEIDLTPVQAGDLLQRGSALLERLTHHPPVQAGIQNLLQRPHGAEPSPLYLQLRTDRADPMLWESLHAAGYGFCALDERWPIARMAKRLRQGSQMTYDGTLRIVAVLSAAGLPTEPQFEVFRQLSLHPRAADVGLRIHVITGDTALLDAAGPRLHLELIATTPLELKNQIVRADPTILHLMGHGGTTAGVDSVTFASFMDFDVQTTTGSITLNRHQLLSSLTESSCWMTVLNACSSADANADVGVETSALAHALASEGVPAVVGMRRLVDASVTNDFCANLYPRIVAGLADAIDVPFGTEAMIDWATVLTDARVSLAQNDPVARDVWTDPVMYTQRPPFRFVVAQSPEAAADVVELQAQLDLFERAFAQLEESGASFELLDEVSVRIANLEDQLADAGT